MLHIPDTNYEASRFYIRTDVPQGLIYPNNERAAEQGWMLFRPRRARGGATSFRLDGRGKAQAEHDQEIPEPR